MATIRIPVYGRDLRAHPHDEMRAAAARERQRHRRLSRPQRTAAPDSRGHLEEHAGFVFTGLIPGGPSGDWLVLQYFNGVVVDYDAMQVEVGFTGDLLAYIRAHDPHAG